MYSAGAKCVQSGSFGDIPLGTQANYDFKESTIDLQPGESLMFFTDGVNEAFSPSGEEFGPERLHKLIENNASLAPEEMCSRISDELDDFQGEDQFDDITIMIIKRA